MRLIRLLGAAIMVLLLSGALVAPSAAQGIEQGTITVTKTWVEGQEPAETVEVCFMITLDAAGEDIYAELCTVDDTYTVTFGPNDPAPLQTGSVYYVWEEVGAGWQVTGDNPVEVSIPTNTGEAFVTFENERVQGVGSVEIHKRVCPNGAPTTDVFAECHGNPPEQEVAFAVDGGEPVAVDSDGNVVFTDLAAGTHTFSETEGPPLDFVDLWVFCSVKGASGGASELATDGPNFSVEVGAGEEIVCDVYNIPENLKGDGETPPSTLPSTGAGTTVADDQTGFVGGLLTLAVVAGAAFALRRRVFSR